MELLAAVPGAVGRNPDDYDFSDRLMISGKTRPPERFNRHPDDLYWRIAWCAVMTALASCPRVNPSNASASSGSMFINVVMTRTPTMAFRHRVH